MSFFGSLSVAVCTKPQKKICFKEEKLLVYFLECPCGIFLIVAAKFALRRIVGFLEALPWAMHFAVTPPNPCDLHQLPKAPDLCTAFCIHLDPPPLFFLYSFPIPSFFF
jgi:hypothetical protein